MFDRAEIEGDVERGVLVEIAAKFKASQADRQGREIAGHAAFRSAAQIADDLRETVFAEVEKRQRRKVVTRERVSDRGADRARGTDHRDATPPQALLEEFARTGEVRLEERARAPGDEVFEPSDLKHMAEFIIFDRLLRERICDARHRDAPGCRLLCSGQMRTPDYSALLTTPELAEDGLRKINTFVISMLQQNNLEDLLWSIVDNAGHLLDFEDCVVYLLEGEVLVQEAGYEESNPDLRSHHREFKLRLGDGVVGKVAQTGEARLVSDTRLDPDYRADDFSGLSELAVPIVFQDRVIGVLDSESHEVDAYDAGDQAIFQSIANIASSRIAWALAERKRREIKQKLEAKNAELERFTYTVSHDLKSPLITIQGFLGFLEKDLARGDHERVRTDIGKIRSTTEKMRYLLDDLLDLARVGRQMGSPHEVSFGVIAREAVELVDGQIAEREVDILIHSDLPVVLADRERLLQVLQNLLSNAIKFLGDQPEPRIEIGARARESSFAECFVRDNGIGIAPERQGEIFGLFDRLNPEIDGTGVGLALVRRIVELHGGRTWVESPGLGHGSTFCFTLRRPDPALRGG